MASFVTDNKSVQHFGSGTLTGTNDITFTRPINTLILTTTSTVNMSLDGGSKFMPLTAGTHTFYHLHLKQIHFTGAGTYSGVGIAI